MLRNLAYAILFGSLPLRLFAQAPSQDGDALTCSSFGQSVLTTVHASGDVVRAVACRTMLKQSVTVVAIAHAPSGYDMLTSETLPIHVGLFGLRRGEARATGEMRFAEDSAQEIDAASLAWDDEPLELAPGRSGYALRITPAYHASGAAESGRGTSMTLFMAQKGQMRPILRDLYLSSWEEVCEHPPCNHDEVATRTFATTYLPTKTSSRGLRDIVLTTTIDEGDPNPKRRIARFNGTQYIVPD